MTITVGFDLDMTLIDPRPGIVRSVAALSAEVGMALDGEYVAANMGPPLEHIFRQIGVAERDMDRFVARYRELYPDIVIPTTVPMPGAEAALDAVHAAGGQVVVVTAKYEPNARRHVTALGWDIDHLVGDLWSAGKAQALRERGAGVYVGDHIGDMAGAAAAGALGIGVTTGPCDERTLRDAGAHVVLADLTEFPAWFNDHVAAARSAQR